MAAADDPRFYAGYGTSAGLALLRAVRQRSREGKGAHGDGGRRAHAVAGRRVARLSKFDARAAAALDAVSRGAIAEMTRTVDALMDYFGDDDASAIFDHLATFLDLLGAALAKHDGGEPRGTADRDPVAGGDARQRILDRREALFPSNPQ